MSDWKTRNYDILALQMDVQDREMDYILEILGSLQDTELAKRILKTALTSTAREARKRLIKDNKKRYALKKSGAYSKESKVTPAKASKLVAEVVASSPRHGLHEYTSRPNTAKLAVRAKVLKSSPLKEIAKDERKAFIATCKDLTAFWQRKTSARLPIKKFSSLSAADMFGRVAREPDVAEDLYRILTAEVEKRIAAALE